MNRIWILDCRFRLSCQSSSRIGVMYLFHPIPFPTCPTPAGWPLGRTLVSLRGPCLSEASWSALQSLRPTHPMWPAGRQWFWVLLPKEKGLGCRDEPRQLQLRKGGAADGVGIGAEPDGLRGLVVDHMSYGSPSTFDVGDADDLFGFGVESHEAIRVQPGFYKPHSVLIVDGHAVRPCVFASRRSPFFHL